MLTFRFDLRKVSISVLSPFSFVMDRYDAPTRPPFFSNTLASLAQIPDSRKEQLPGMELTPMGGQVVTGWELEF